MDIETVKVIYIFIDIFFLTYLVGYSIFLILSVTVGSVSLYEQRRRQSLYNTIEHDYYFPISIIVPAFNESKTVVDTVKSLLDLDYRLYEIIIVDDGSTDGTAECLVNHFGLARLDRPIRKRIFCRPEEAIYVSYQQKVPITLIRKQNGGKADALNMGINASEYPYFICMDADSILQADALTNIARPVMEQNDVIACGGLVRIVNDVVIEKGRLIDYRMPRNLLLCLQILEYDRTFLAARLLFDKFNGNLIISGAFGLFQKEMVVCVGGYDAQTIGEDMELVIKLHDFCRANRIPYHIKYAADAVCWSQAPDNLKDLKKQRRRWHIGLFQSLTIHRELLFNPVHGMLSFISFLYFVIYELLSPYIEMLGILSILVAIHYNLINVPYMILFFAIYAVFGGVMSLTAFFSRIYAMHIKLRPKDMLKAILLCLIENIGLRAVLMFTRLTAFVGYRKNKTNWGAMQRREMKHKTEE